MNSKVSLQIPAIVITAILMGCARMPVTMPVVKAPTVAPASAKVEFDALCLTKDETQMSGVPAGVVRIIEGDERTFYVRMGDTKGKWHKLSPDLVVDWKADPEIQVVKISEDKVTVKAIKPGTGFATAMTTKEGKKLEGSITVEVIPAPKATALVLKKGPELTAKDWDNPKMGVGDSITVWVRGWVLDPKEGEKTFKLPADAKITVKAVPRPDEWSITPGPDHSFTIKQVKPLSLGAGAFQILVEFKDGRKLESALIPDTK